MEKVDKYINSVYKNVKASNEEIGIMKEEMKDHLLQSINELKEEGNSEDESINIAISRFGEVSDMKQQFAKIYTVQRRFSKSILVMAVVFLFLGIVSLMFKPIMNKVTGIVIGQIFNNITNTIEQDGEISEEKIRVLFEKNEKYFIGDSKKLKYISIFKYPKDYIGKLDGERLNYKKSQYIYPSIETLNEDLEKNGYISNESSGKEFFSGSNKWYVSIEYISSESNYYIILVGVGCLIAYWLLFGVWSTINVYNVKVSNLGWFISFFIFNVFAYILFKSKNRGQIKIETRQVLY